MRKRGADQFRENTASETPCCVAVRAGALFLGMTQQQLDDLGAGAARQRLQPNDIIGLGEDFGLSLK